MLLRATKRNIRGRETGPLTSDGGSWENGGGSTTEALVRLAVVEQVTDAVCSVLEQRCRSEDDDTDGWIDKWDAIERSDQPGEFPHIAEIFE